MPVITLVFGYCCGGEEVCRKVVETLGYKLFSDQILVAETSRRFAVDENKLSRAMTGKTSIFNKFTHERERSLACLKVVLAEALKQDNVVFSGLAGHMIPRNISHVLRACIIAEMPYRLQLATGGYGLSEKDALKKIRKDDESHVLWVDYLFGGSDPWASEFYDIVIPMDKSSVEEAADLICVNVGKEVLKANAASNRAADDFLLAAEVNLKLAGEGHDILVSGKDGHITATINKQVLMLSSLENELKKIISTVPGVKGVETKVGPGFYKTDIYRKFDFDVPLPSKVLLVDDEREFVQTLSDRLQMRDLGSAVVYDGEQALSAIAEEEPEVMVLDLKMPGIDGVEVLRRVKTEHPNIEVIVLTGHGSPEVEKLCMELGACAYLEKPVDVEALAATMKDAYRKARQKSGA
jgi:two-component system, OmpR family, response regulator CpxR